MTLHQTILSIAIFSIACPIWGADTAPQRPCESLPSLRIPNLTVTASTSVAAGSFKLPGAATTPTVQVPDFCRVAVTVGKELRMEVWMPKQWNRKLLAVGNGGMAGSISYAAMVKPLQQGYAATSTDTGHQAESNTDGEWALGHYERVVNFADRGTHLMAEAAKVVLNAFYGAQPAHAYFNGCSQGGHEAMIEAQRYPADFDGIIAGGPAANWTHHYIGGHLWMALAMEGDGYIPASKVPVVANAVNEPILATLNLPTTRRCSTLHGIPAN